MQWLRATVCSAAGCYRGFAPAASILPIKIGRGGGRIPEEDILRGLRWLLRDDNWQRYGVRVVNISVGGDFPQDLAGQPGLPCGACPGTARRGHRCRGRQSWGRRTAGAGPDADGVDGRRYRRSEPPLARDPQSTKWKAFRSIITTTASSPGNIALMRKPEMLALARWLPSPILPPSFVLRETYAIARLRQVLDGDDGDQLDSLLRHWEQRLHAGADAAPDDGAQWMPEVWHALRRRMNAHKWVHPYYQHVDGTSVAVAQVSAVAAQMLEANPALTADAYVRLMLVETCAAAAAPAATTDWRRLAPAGPGRGGRAACIRWPTDAVFRAAVRVCSDFELHKWTAQGKLTVLALERLPEYVWRNAYISAVMRHTHTGSVCTGSFNGWQPGHLALQPAAQGGGMQRCAALGQHLYRFWVESTAITLTVVGSAIWRTPTRESGYTMDTARYHEWSANSRQSAYNHLNSI